MTPRSIAIGNLQSSGYARNRKLLLLYFVGSKKLTSSTTKSRCVAYLLPNTCTENPQALKGVVPVLNSMGKWRKVKRTFTHTQWSFHSDTIQIYWPRKAPRIAVVTYSVGCCSNLVNGSHSIADMGRKENTKAPEQKSQSQIEDCLRDEWWSGPDSIDRLLSALWDDEQRDLQLKQISADFSDLQRRHGNAFCKPSWIFTKKSVFLCSVPDVLINYKSVFLQQNAW